jgi:hypothetical protein
MAEIMLLLIFLLLLLLAMQLSQERAGREAAEKELAETKKEPAYEAGKVPLLERPGPPDAGKLGPSGASSSLATSYGPPGTPSGILECLPEICSP